MFEAVGRKLFAADNAGFLIARMENGVQVMKQNGDFVKWTSVVIQDLSSDRESNFFLGSFHQTANRFFFHDTFIRP